MGERYTEFSLKDRKAVINIHFIQGIDLITVV